MATRELGQDVLAVTLDRVRRNGRTYSLTTTVVTRTEIGSHERKSVMLHELTKDGAESEARRQR